MDRSTGTLYWLIAIGVWIMALILIAAVVLGCGGADFVLDPPTATDASDAGPIETADADAGPDRVVGIPHPDAGPSDASPPDADASPPDAAPAPDSGCAPFPTSIAQCPRTQLPGYPPQIAYTIPDQYCVVLYDGPFPNADPPGTPVIMPMPATCRCNPPPQSMGYTTACLTDQAAAVCPAGSTFHGSGGIFTDDAGPQSEIICYGTGDGG